MGEIVYVLIFVVYICVLGLFLWIFRGFDL